MYLTIYVDDIIIACDNHAYVLEGTVSCGIRFSGSMFDTHVFTDADWAAGDMLTRRFTTGDVVFAAGGPLARQSKL